MVLNPNEEMAYAEELLTENEILVEELSVASEDGDLEPLDELGLAYYQDVQDLTTEYLDAVEELQGSVETADVSDATA